MSFRDNFPTNIKTGHTAIFKVTIFIRAARATRAVIDGHASEGAIVGT